jgi:carbon storage regulator CsrA
MYVLKRKPGETILINGTIRITVCGFKGSRVLLGVTAPSEIPIVREKPNGFHPGTIPTDVQKEAG